MGIEIDGVQLTESGALKVKWRGDPSAAGYFVNVFIQHKGSPQVVIWTSSKVAEAGWMLSR